MNSTKLLENIHALLFDLATRIAQANSLNLLGDAIRAENLYCKLLQLVFGWELHNANLDRTNQETYDLVNDKKDLFVQVTSTKNHKIKYDAIISKLDTLPRGSKMVLIYISKEVDAKYLKQKSVANDVSYEGFDSGKLLIQINGRCNTVEELLRINDLLASELTPMALTALSSSAAQEIQFPTQKAKQLSSTNDIQRDKIISDLYEFSQKGNGLFTGGPGYGKSYIIDHLQALYQANQLDCFVIRINELITADDQEMSEQVGIESNWLIALKKMPDRKHKGLLVFDGFDTAKEPHVISKVSKYIETAINQLENFNILVSARTYDAEKSPQLLELFPNKSGASVRKFEIVELTEEEVIIYLTKIDQLTIYSNCNDSLKNLLRTPYFLKLFTEIVKEHTGTDPEELTGIYTEEQLLTLYWKKKVPLNSQADIFLDTLTQMLSNKETLSCHRRDIVNTLNLATCDALMSDGLLTLGTSANIISFSHNILLDFAISRYLLSPDLKALMSLVEENPRHPFIFRSSYIYLYTNLWTNRRDVFWLHHSEMGAIATPLFRLVHQTIVNYVLTTLFLTVEDVAPIFAKEDFEDRALAIKKILESIRFTKKVNLGKTEAELFQQCSLQISPATIWELGYLINVAIEQNLAKSENAILQILAISSNNYLKHVLAHRTDNILKFSMERNGGMWAIKNYTTLYAFHAEPNILLDEFLLVLNDKESPIFMFHVLADHVTNIAKSDPHFASRIYSTIYAHAETSEEVTSLGGVTFGIRSNRKQEYSSVLHRLERHFPQLIETAPTAFIGLGCEILNKQLLEIHHYGEAPLVRTFDFAGYEATYLTDNSIDEYYRVKDDGPHTHIRNIIKFFQHQEEEGRSQNLIDYFTVFSKNAKASTLWIRLAIFITERSPEFTQFAFQLIHNNSLPGRREFIFYACKLLKVYWPEFTPQQRKSLEEKILAYSLDDIDGYDIDDLNQVISQLLSSIPDTQIEHQDVKNFLNLHGTKAPLQERHSAVLRNYTPSEEEKLDRFGLSGENSDHVILYDKIKQVESFNDRYRQENEKQLSEHDYISVYHAAVFLFENNSTVISGNSKFNSRINYEIVLFTEKILVLANDLSDEILNWIEELAITFLDSPQYQKPYDAGSLTNRDSGTVNERTICCSIIIALMYKYNKENIVDKVITFFDDNNRTIRIKALRASAYLWHHHYEQFWPIVFQRISIEKDAPCLAELIDSINYSNIIDANRDEAETAAQQLKEVIQNNDVWEILLNHYGAFLIRLHVFHGSIIAANIIYEMLDNKPFAKELQHFIFQTLNTNDPNYDHRNSKVLPILTTLLNKNFDELADGHLDNDKSAKSLELIDDFSQQIYYTILRDTESKLTEKEKQTNKELYYKNIKSLLKIIVQRSKQTQNGFMVAHTAYHLLKAINELFDCDPSFMLEQASAIVDCAAANNFTYDSLTMEEITNFAEKILLYHKSLLKDTNHFKQLLSILDHFANSGWQGALELTWRIKDIF